MTKERQQPWPVMNEQQAAAVDAVLGAGERVTTGNEPRRLTIYVCPECGFTSAGSGRCPMHSMTNPTETERFEVEVVEPGHDEQTEDEHTKLDRAMGLLDEIADDAAEGRLDQRNCEEDAQRMAAIFRGDRARGVLEKGDRGG